MGVVAPSFDDLIALGLAEAQSRRTELKFNDGDVAEAQLHASGAMADANVRYAAQLFKNRFLDGAKGDDLAALVDDSINLQKQVATKAAGSVAFTRVAATGPAGSIPINAKVGTAFDAEGKQIVFLTNAAVAFALNQQGPLSVTVTAVESGSAGNVAIASVNRVIDALFDTFTVTNAAVMAGGNAAEGDDPLRVRARTFWLTLRRGTLAALEFGALQVPAVRVAIAVEDALTGDVTVRVSDANGNSNLQMLNDVEAELEEWRAAGINVNVVGGTTLTVAMVIQLDNVAAGFSVTAKGPTIIAAVTALMNKRRVGETLHLDSVIASVIGVSSDEIFNVSFPSITVGGVAASTTADIVPGALQLIRPGTITVQAA